MARNRARIVRPQRWARADFRITGLLIKRFLNKAAGTAHGADQWSAEQLCDMPEEALAELAELWGMAMHTGEGPRAWLEVRTVTIPKGAIGDYQLPRRFGEHV